MMVMEHVTRKIIDSRVIILESVMNNIRISQLVIAKTQLGHLITQLVFIRSRIWKCFHSKEQRGQT